jgi:hypothetical protein
VTALAHPIPTANNTRDDLWLDKDTLQSHCTPVPSATPIDCTHLIGAKHCTRDVEFYMFLGNLVL